MRRLRWFEAELDWLGVVWDIVTVRCGGGEASWLGRRVGEGVMFVEELSFVLGE